MQTERSTSQARWCGLAMMLTSLCLPAVALTNVLTTPLGWQTASIESGLSRLKDEFLDESVQLDTEYVGAVLRNADGSFEFTHGQGKPGQDKVSFRIRRPEDAELVGLWHTHGSHGPTRAIFSPTDAELVRTTGLPFYLITPDGEIRVLRPEHVSGQQRPRRISGTMARLPRGSHPGERVRGQMVQPRPPRGCSDVIEV